MAKEQTQLPEKSIESLLFEANMAAIQPKANELQKVESINWEDDAAMKALARKELVFMLQNPLISASTKLGTIRELLDRLEGKPIQRTDARVLTQTKGEIVIKLVD